MRPTPPKYKEIAERVAKVSGLEYFQIEIIPSPWVGPVVCDVNPHSFDVMEGLLNNTVQEHTESAIRGWLDES